MVSIAMYMLDEEWMLSDLSEGEASMFTFYIQVEYDSEATPMRIMASTAISLNYTARFFRRY